MSVLLTEIENNVLTISLNRPEKHNALNTALTQALLDALKDAERDSQVRAIIVHGNGKSF